MNLQIIYQYEKGLSIIIDKYNINSAFIKGIVFISISCAIVLIPIIIIINNISSLLEKRVLESFEKNLYKIENVVNLIEDYNYSFLFVEKTSKNSIGLFTYNDLGVFCKQDIDEADIAILEKIILDDKYKIITKSKNAIYFTQFTKFGCGYGIAYSMNGEVPMDRTINNIKVLDYNWYYYEMR